MKTLWGRSSVIMPIFLSMLVVLAVVLAAATIKIEPQGHEYTVERLGLYTRALKPRITNVTVRRRNAARGRRAVIAEAGAAASTAVSEGVETGGVTALNDVVGQKYADAFAPLSGPIAWITELSSAAGHNAPVAPPRRPDPPATGT